jgi:hypothetical protein
MNEITIWNYDTMEIRTLEIDGEQEVEIYV